MKLINNYHAKIITTILLFLLFYISVNGQNCTINKVHRQVVDYSSFGLIKEEYNKLKNSDSSSYRIMLIKFSNITEKKRCYLLSIVPNKKKCLKVLSEDSLLYTEIFNLSQKDNSSSSLKTNWENGFFISNCENLVSTHSTEILIVCNSSLNIWTEYLSMDGKMKETLESNKEYTCLKDFYELIEKTINSLDL